MRTFLCVFMVEKNLPVSLPTMHCNVQEPGCIVSWIGSNMSPVSHFTFARGLRKFIVHTLTVSLQRPLVALLRGIHKNKPILPKC